MITRNPDKGSILHYLILLAILGLAYYIGFIPHIKYVYPLHVDEWVHMARAESLMTTGNLAFPDPFSGSLMGLGTNLEAGFQLFWGVFQSISGISWPDVFRFFPGVIFVFTVLSVYIMARREGFGLEASFFALLIPTTVGVLGPAFLVPVSLGLLFTPLILFLALNFHKVWSYLLIFVFTCFLLAIHAPSAIYPIVLLTPYILLHLKGDYRHSIFLGLSLLLPFLIIFPWIFSLLLPTAKGLLIRQVPSEFIQLPRVIQSYGYVPVILALVGTFTLALKGGKRNYAIALGLLALLLMLVFYYSFHYGVPIVYERGLVYMMLMLGIIAGAGLAAIGAIKIPEKAANSIKIPAPAQYSGKALAVMLAVFILAVTVPLRQATQYYHMIDKQDYQAFIWIKENLNKDAGMAIVDPWKATAFSAITGKRVYTRIHVAPMAEDKLAYDFLKNGSSDTAFLKSNGISLVYTRIYDGNQDSNSEFPSDNPDLQKASQNIYVVR